MKETSTKRFEVDIANIGTGLQLIYEVEQRPCSSNGKVKTSIVRSNAHEVAVMLQNIADLYVEQAAEKAGIYDLPLGNHTAEGFLPVGLFAL